MIAALLVAVAASACAPTPAATDTDGEDSEGQTAGTSDGELTGDASEGQLCMIPNEYLEISLIGSEGKCVSTPEEPDTGDIVGVYSLVPGGFQVESESLTKRIGPMQPAIPVGTFVRLRFGCDNGWYGGPGAWILIDNVASIDGAPNPTESGERMWFAVAARGEAQWSKPLEHFEWSFETVCATGEIGEAYERVMSLTLAGEGFEVTAQPESSASFEIPAGAHAGAYVLENVNITDDIADGGDIASAYNFLITRAD